MHGRTLVTEELRYSGGGRTLKADQILGTRNNFLWTLCVEEAVDDT